MNTTKTVRRGLALATLVGALAAPAALAAPVEERLPDSGIESSGAAPAQVRVVEVQPDPGFDWGDAGIGASGAIAVLAIGAGAAVAITHRPRRRTLA